MLLLAVNFRRICSWVKYFIATRRESNYFYYMIVKISLKPVSIALTLGILAVLLILASLAGYLVPHFTGRGEAIALLNVDSEQNIPSFFSASIILFAALLLAVITAYKRKQGAPYVLHWAILAFGFLFMAVDEATSIHEKLNGPMAHLLGEGRADIFYYAWVVPGIVIVLVLGLFFLKFLWDLPATTRWLFCAAAFVYLGGAIGFELVGNHYALLSGTESWRYIASAHLEEGLEMTGMVLFIFALLQYVAETCGEVRFRLDEAPYERISADMRKKVIALSTHDSPVSPPGALIASRRSNRPSRGYSDPRR